MNKKAQNLAVTFNNPMVATSKEEVKEKEQDYVNSAVSFEREERAISGHTFFSFIQTFGPLAACWLVLLLIIIFHIYFTSVISETNTKLKAEIENVTGNDLSELKNKLTHLLEENQNLSLDNDNLKNNYSYLTEQIQYMENNLNELNVSRSQWSIDAYCPKINNARICSPCRSGWMSYQSSCYAMNDAQPADQRTWAGAQADCRGRISDLTAVAGEQEKNYVFAISVPETGITGFWIGLRAVNGTWKWIDGTDLANQMWVDKPAADGQCVTSLRGSGWRSVSCETKNAWICEKKALSV